MSMLYLAPAACSVLLVAGARLPRRARSRWGVAVALAGAAAATGLAVAGERDWRTTSLDADVALVVGAGSACAWVLAAVLGPAGERWRTGALVGIASAGFGLFAGNQWVAPGLLFWIFPGGA